MTGYWSFINREAPLLGYGFGFAFVSSFGQTFLVSLFVPSFRADFALGNAEFGALYSAATLASAGLLPWAGQGIDRWPLRRFSLAVLALLAVSALLLAASWHVATLAVGLLGVRLAGQGLSSHTAMTAMARYYSSQRGRALSVASLGFPAGEALLPLLLTGLIAAGGWRASWLLVAGVVVALFTPLLLGLLRRSKVPEAAELHPQGTEGEGAWRRRDVLRDLRFYAILPAALLPPFWTTGFLLYQTTLAESRGWSLTLMASAFVAFAAGRVVFALLVGPAIDRVSARWLFPLVNLPLAGAAGTLLVAEAPWGAYAFMALLGVTMGVSANLKSALWAELYGTRHLGAIKSMMAALMVLSTAASPALVGAVLDHADGIGGLLWGAVASVGGAGLLALVILPIGGGREAPPRTSAHGQG